jgi:hypothetical protein
VLWFYCYDNTFELATFLALFELAAFLTLLAVSFSTTACDYLLWKWELLFNCDIGRVGTLDRDTSRDCKGVSFLFGGV